MKDSIVGIRECPQEPSNAEQAGKSLRKITSNDSGTMRMLWSKPAGSLQWEMLRAWLVKRDIQ